MGIKSNWGTWITVVMVLFMSFIVGLGIMVTRQPESLIEEDYYQKGLKHNENRESVMMGEFVKVSFQGDELILTYDSVGYSTSIQCKNVANPDLDFSLDAQDSLPVNQQTFTLKSVEKGRYLIWIDGVVNGDRFNKKTHFSQD